jgi:hypothetical protein
MEDIGSQLGVKSLEDWYNIKYRDVVQKGGKVVINHYKSSLYKMLQSLYPSYNWKADKFVNKPKNYWTDINHQKEFMDKIATDLSVTSVSDWYSVQTTAVITKGGTPLLNKYGRSLQKVLEAVYPEHTWDALNFTRFARHHFDNSENIQKFLDHIAKRLKIERPEQWRDVSHK